MIKKKTWNRIFAAINTIPDKDWNDFLDKHLKSKEGIIKKEKIQELKKKINKTDKECKALLNKMKKKEKTAKYIFTSAVDGKEYYITKYGVARINGFIDFMRAERKKLLTSKEQRLNEKTWLPTFDDILTSIITRCNQDGCFLCWALPKHNIAPLYLEMGEDIKER